MSATALFLAAPTVVHGKVVNGTGMIALAQKARWDNVALEVEMPSVRCLTALETPKPRQPALPVSVLSTQIYPSLVRQSLVVGPKAYLAKNPSEPN